MGCSDGGLQSVRSGLRCRSDPRLSRGDRRCQSRSRSSGGGCQRDPSGEADFRRGKSRGSGSDHRSRFACTGSGDGGSGHSTGLGSRSRGRRCQRHPSCEADLGFGRGLNDDLGRSDLRYDRSSSQRNGSAGGYFGSRSSDRRCQRHSSSEADLGLGGSDQRLRRGGGQGRSGNEGDSDLLLDHVRESAMNTLV